MSISVRRFTTTDLDFGMRLDAAVGWNHTRCDLLRMVAYEPEGCLLASWDGGPAGTATTTSYGQRLAWIGMMLVHEDLRRRGIATGLMRECLDYLRDHEVATIKLDASADGYPVYRKLDFQDEWIVQRWLREGDDTGADLRGGGAIGDHSLKLDRQCFGVDRGDWLRRLAADSVVLQQPDGFGMLRAGRKAAYLGPLVANGERVARGMAEQLLSETAAAVMWDIPSPNAAAEALAAELGFAPVRQLTRMRLGEPCEGELLMHYAAADLATG